MAQSYLVGVACMFLPLDGLGVDAITPWLFEVTEVLWFLAWKWKCFLLVPVPRGIWCSLIFSLSLNSPICLSESKYVDKLWTKITLCSKCLQRQNPCKCWLYCPRTRFPTGLNFCSYSVLYVYHTVLSRRTILKMKKQNVFTTSVKSMTKLPFISGINR